MPQKLRTFSRVLSSTCSPQLAIAIFRESMPGTGFTVSLVLVAALEGYGGHHPLAVE